MTDRTYNGIHSMVSNMQGTMKREKPLLYNYIISLTEICFAFIKINILYIDQYIVQSEESANLLGTETISV